MSSTYGDKLFYRFNYMVLFFSALTCLLPLIHIVSLSLSSQTNVMSGTVTFWPQGLSFQSYKLLLYGTNVIHALWNNIYITVIGVTGSLILTIAAAYPLSRKEMPARRFLTLAIVFTMLFSGGLIPVFLVVKSLGLLDSYGAIWLPALINTFNMLVMRSSFENLPGELDEAARIDGCGEWRYLTKIVLPLSLPVMATIGLFYAVAYWNSFFSLLMFIQDTKKYNLAVLVQQMIQSQSVLQDMKSMRPSERILATPEGIKAAGIMVMIVPMLLVYPFLQRFL